MSRKHSFVLTLSNNVTEKEGVNYLIENYTGFFKVDLITKKELLNLLNIEHRFLQAFDLIYVPEMVGKVVDEEFIQTYLVNLNLIFNEMIKYVNLTKAIIPLYECFKSVKLFCSHKNTKFF